MKEQAGKPTTNNRDNCAFGWKRALLNFDEGGHEVASSSLSVRQRWHCHYTNIYHTPECMVLYQTAVPVDGNSHSTFRTQDFRHVNL